ncbi:DegT/DnrJ/EryC1/StrS family aminotransferase [Pseudomonas sp. RTB3]|uniref:DegT/DnrJ/EryC1/StrS family aminotransferase n=1 Tax=unclassified Pseudomonas TaxID=196821 RepID=UPI002B236E17|nr:MULTISPECIES: DegT/DnrJ/EryC1/StrS family aminotransferase [unclassified Pseudomonas]MEB0006014.1 DegT/DnrJ/EryC1/StrS family aminotransferase [Pseudomonas sp. RTB2]MEB0018895.1 DegT/DnrJ/EryC1/StrS family aminotransferase [Pseudomonas sp. RTB3]MEB0269472.1 DegT/DnrJ/EryC1/StrS family aminotransferase [Pseudomonas sp. 5B4]
MSRIHYTKPSVGELEASYVLDAVQNGWGERCYEYITRFEKAFAEHMGVPYAIATSSCTGALHMGMAALEIGSGDEVILGNTNWIASAAPITYLGATPVFVDVSPDSWCLDPEKVRQAITPRTKAIVAVHLYGNLCDMDALLAIGREFGIAVIEDAAEAIGSQWRAKPAGSLGTFGAFSFHGTKTLTTGEGGMFVTSDRSVYERVLTLSNHGRVNGSTRQFWPDFIGFKYKMSNLQAAIGCAQIERVNDLIERKRAIFANYASALLEIPGISMNPQPDHSRNGYWMPTLVFEESTGITRDTLIEAFKTSDIDARVFFWPLSSLPMFSAMDVDTPVAFSLSERAINLPSYHDMTDSDQQRVIAVVRAVCASRGLGLL